MTTRKIGNEFYLVPDIARATGVSRQGILDAITHNRIKHAQRLGRFYVVPKKDAEAYIQKHNARKHDEDNDHAGDDVRLCPQA